jgi:predicted DNA-binding transcriptional regulator AlpA
MSVTVNRPKKVYDSNTKPRSVASLTLNENTRLRVGHLLTLLDISAPTFYRRLKAGKFPQPTGHMKNHPYWSVDAVRPYLNVHAISNSMSREGASHE